MLLLMTFHESYGDLPANLLRLYRRFNVSPADHDQILATFGVTWESKGIPWEDVIAYVKAASSSGTYRPSQYL